MGREGHYLFTSLAEGARAMTRVHLADQPGWPIRAEALVRRARAPRMHLASDRDCRLLPVCAVPRVAASASIAAKPLATATAAGVRMYMASSGTDRDRVAAAAAGVRMHLATTVWHESCQLPAALQGLKMHFAEQPGGTGQLHRHYVDAAEERGQIVPELSILTSFYYFRRWDLAKVKARFPGVCVHIFADSGAFSATTLGGSVKLAEYAKWLKKNAAHIATYANLDVIGDPEKTYRNQKLLETEGLAPIPVFHVGSGFEHLDRYIAEGYTYLAVGGMVPYLKNSGVDRLANWCREVFARTEPAGVRVHGFGVGTTWNIASQFPWFSIDASSWTSVFQFRSLSLFDEVRGHFVAIDLGAKSKEVLAHGTLLRRYGYSPNDFYPASKFEYVKAGALSVMSMLRAEAYLRARREERDAKIETE